MVTGSLTILSDDGLRRAVVWLRENGVSVDHWRRYAPEDRPWAFVRCCRPSPSVPFHAVLDQVVETVNARSIR